MSNHSRKSEAGSAAGIGTLLAAAAGAYWLWGSKDAAKHRQLAKSWMLKARAEVMDQVGKLQHLDRAHYMKIVNRVTAAAGAAAAASRPEVARLTRDLREAWSHIALQVKQNSSRPTRSSAKKSPKTKAKTSARRITRKKTTKK